MSRRHLQGFLISLQLLKKHFIVGVNKGELSEKYKYGFISIKNVYREFYIDNKVYFTMKLNGKENLYSCRLNKICFILPFYKDFYPIFKNEDESWMNDTFLV